MRILQNTAQREVHGVSFSPDANTLVAGGSGGFDIWSLLNGYHDSIEYHATKSLYAFELDPRERWLYISDARGGCSLFSLSTRKWSRLPGNEYNHHVVSLARTADATRLAVSRGGAGKNRLECWAIDSDGAFSLAWAIRNGRFLTSVDTVYFERDDNSFTNAVAFSCDTRLLAVAGEWDAASRCCRVHLRSAADGKLVGEVGTLPSTFAQLLFLPDGSGLIGYEQYGLHLIGLRDTRVLSLAPQGRAHFRAAAVHPSGRWVVTVANDGCARFWSLPDLEPGRVYKWGTGKLHSIAFSLDGALAAAGSDKGKVVVWDVDL